jgi:hypothetical protein
VAWFLIAAVVALAAVPAYLALPASWRPVATRISCAAIAALGCLRALRWARSSIGAVPASALDSPPPTLPVPDLDWRFARLRDDVIWSSRSHRYFDVILWPRLVELGAPERSRPPSRRGLLRRGPSLRGLEAVVAEIERRP